MGEIGNGTTWLLRVLGEELDELAARTAEHIRDEIPEYAGVPEIGSNSAQHLRTFVDWCTRGGDHDELLSFEHNVTLVRLETGFELLPTLSAYRIGDIDLRNWTLSVIGRKDASANVEDVGELLGLWSTYGERARNVTIANYVAQEHHRTTAEAADRRDLLDDMIHGRLGGTEFTTRLRRLGCEVGERHHMVVVSLPSTPFATARDRIQDLATRVESTLQRAQGTKPFVAITHSQITILTSGRQGRSQVGDAVRAAILPARVDSDTGSKTSESKTADHLRGGVSLPFKHLGQAREAYQQAVLAAEISSAGSPVTILEELSAFDFMVDTASADVLKFASSSVLRELSQGDEYALELVDTISVYMQSGMSARSTAERLHVHTNTVYYRLSRIELLFGINSHDYWQLLDLLIYVRIFGRVGTTHRLFADDDFG